MRRATYGATDAENVELDFVTSSITSNQGDKYLVERSRIFQISGCHF